MAGDETERPLAFIISIDQAEELFRAEGREESASRLVLLADIATSQGEARMVWTVPLCVPPRSRRSIDVLLF